MSEIFMTIEEDKPVPEDQKQDRMASRAMDAEIAERVMGLVPYQSSQHEAGAQFYMERPCHALPDSPDKGGETPCYSTDIAAAMEVVEKMRADSWDVSISNAVDSTTAWAAGFYGSSADGKYLITGEYESDSLPEAICRAALEALADGQQTKETK